MAGACCLVKFTNRTASKNMTISTLNINSTGAKSVDTTWVNDTLYSSQSQIMLPSLVSYTGAEYAGVLLIEHSTHGYNDGDS